MDTNIWLRGSYRKFRENDTVNTWRTVESFVVSNNLRHCLVKQQGGYYKIEKDGTLTFVTPTLRSITFKELYKKLKDETIFR
jgi:hypothetical protein